MKCIFKPTRFTMQFLGILQRILRSTIFNICLLIFGFGLGFFCAFLTVHYNAVSNSDYQFITKIEKAVDELVELDKKYVEQQEYIRAQLKLFKYKIAHDQHNFDDVLRLNTNTNSIKYISK